jgi:hypothetical protein
MTLKSSKWAGNKPGYKSVCFCGTIDLLSRQKVEQLTLAGVSFGRKEVTPTNLVCEYCQIGGFGTSTFPFSMCRFCGASPSYHHGRCCMNKTVGRPHSMRSEIGSVQSGKSLPEVSEERFGEFVIDSNHSEEYMFKLTYGYINQSTVNSEEATIVKTYLERQGFTEWFAKKAKEHKAAQRSQEILQNLKRSSMKMFQAQILPITVGNKLTCRLPVIRSETEMYV